MQVFYFSGTGNSLVVAHKITEALSDATLSPMVAALKDDNTAPDSDAIGLVFPCHGFTCPSLVQTFLKQLHVKPNDYVFAAITRGGTKIRAFEQIEKQLRKKGCGLSAGFVFNMPSNDPKFLDFESHSKDHVTVFDQAVDSHVKEIAPIIDARQKHMDNLDGSTVGKSKLAARIIENLVAFSVLNLAPSTKKYFYTQNSCNGCGVCSEVCPSGKIAMQSGKPVWKKQINCYMCYACLNYCHKSSIQIYDKYYMKSFTSQNGRYHHPTVNAKTLAKQKGE